MYPRVRLRNSFGFLILLLTLQTEKTLAHKEWVHQHQSIQAYELLKMQYPVIENTPMNAFIGALGGDCGSLPWSQGNITNGAYREDCEDAIYGNVGVLNATVSATHFWDADAGDNSQISICTPICHDYVNAYQKALLWMNGHFPLMLSTAGSSPTGQFPLELVCITGDFAGRTARFSNPTGGTSFYFSYSSLIDLYKTGIVTCETIDNVAWPAQNAWAAVYHFQFQLTETVRQRLAFQILGRIAHLLGDMSVPAHAHNNIHPDGFWEPTLGTNDPYEVSMGSDYNDCWSEPPWPGLTCWNASNASRQGPLLDTYASVPSRDRNRMLRYLFYTTNQVADRFPSRDNDGDANYATSYGEDDYSVLNIIQEITHPFPRWLDNLLSNK